MQAEAERSKPLLKRTKEHEGAKKGGGAVIDNRPIKSRNSSQECKSPSGRKILLGSEMIRALYGNDRVARIHEKRC